ncbi:MAG: hypothetical protein OXF88_04780, partial [Rhodobacteraceae bacterium]|nr:hypothetical protein [Paracoccaceae bacterium]
VWGAFPVESEIFRLPNRWFLCQGGYEMAGTMAARQEERVVVSNTCHAHEPAAMPGQLNTDGRNRPGVDGVFSCGP